MRSVPRINALLVPPRVRDVKRLLRDNGYTIECPGKGDHTYESAWG